MDVARADNSHLDLILLHLGTKTVEEGLGCVFGGCVCKGSRPDTQVRERAGDSPSDSFPLILLYLKTDIAI